MQIPVKKSYDARTELLIAVRHRVAFAGPERFSLSTYVGQVDSDRWTPATYGGDEIALNELRFDADTDLFEWSEERRGGMEPIPAEVAAKLDLVADSLKWGSCGRVACLAGHGAMQIWETQRKVVSYAAAMDELGLDIRTCDIEVRYMHPFRKEFEALVDVGTEMNVAEWIVTLLVLEAAIDAGKKGLSYNEVLDRLEGITDPADEVDTGMDADDDDADEYV